MRQPQLPPERRFFLFSLLSAALALRSTQLVSDKGETPAQSPEHEQYGRAVKGAVPFKRRAAETKPVTFCSAVRLSALTPEARVQEEQ